ncbi:hypothetical protein M405DRAFT_168722 [Rhizopogon salebrosus TDB-379]|jgi:hypothetical protein|nr:hypothetical protein M405DRAFT_168722 [Rhizopogon salebrosus TDB-379]
MNVNISRYIPSHPHSILAHFQGRLKPEGLCRFILLPHFCLVTISRLLIPSLRKMLSDSVILVALYNKVTMQFDIISLLGITSQNKECKDRMSAAGTAVTVNVHAE